MNLKHNEPNQYPSLPENTIFVWVFPIPSQIEEIEKCLPILSSDEYERAKQYLFAKDYKRSVFSKAKMKSILSHYAKIPHQELVFKKNYFGKPFLWINGHPSHLKFNLSHAANYFAITLANQIEVGIDIEEIKPFPHFQSIAEEYFSPLEYQHLLQLSEEQQILTFFRYWSMKEAFVKGLGIGIGEGASYLKNISCLHEDFQINLNDYTHLSSTHNFSKLNELKNLRECDHTIWTVKSLPLAALDHVLSIAYLGENYSVEIIGEGSKINDCCAGPGSKGVGLPSTQS